MALKVLPPDLTQTSPASRFQQEARPASAPNHLNVCTIEAVSENTRCRQFIAMELNDAAAMAGRPSPAAKALDIASRWNG